MDGSAARQSEEIGLDPAVRPRIAIVGSGFSGIGMAVHLRRAGYTNFVILERAAGLGGTWRDNDYPGAACDVPVHLYSFSFARNPDWSRRYGEQPEILDYLADTARRHGLMPHFRFNANFAGANWDEAGLFWRIELQDGRMLEADILIGAWGGLSNPALPCIAGIERFAGPVFHSAQWDHAVDLRGRRIGVIGTGASAVQFAPRIAPLAKSLAIFQRTPPWVISKQDRVISDRTKRLFKAVGLAQTALRGATYGVLESRAAGFVLNPNIMRGAMRYAKTHLRKGVADPALRQKLTPGYVMGCKRILISNDWYPMFNRGNVHLVTEAIDEVEPDGIRTRDGTLHECDVIILGTGFQTNDYALPFRIRGRHHADLAELWLRAGPAAYLGTTIPDFPNLFLLMGPNTGLGHNSMIYMIESQIGYVMRAIGLLRRRGARAMDVRKPKFHAYNAELQVRMRRTVWMSGCSSWYATRQGKVTALWPGFTFQFRRRTRTVDPADYQFMD